MQASFYVDLKGFQFTYDKSNRISNNVSIVHVFSMYEGKDKIHLYVDVNSCHNIILSPLKLFYVKSIYFFSLKYSKKNS
jgi:hypothetical protein